jgi:hypothetical protein
MSNRTLKRMGRTAAALTWIAASLAASIVHAVSPPWTAAGSTGVVDEGTDAANVVFTSGWATLAPALGAGTVELRYNVTATEGLVAGGYDGYLMEARLKDTGTNARVRVQLMEYSLRLGTVQQRMLIDSDAFPASSSFQVRSNPACWPAWRFDFNNNAYYVLVTLTRSAAGGDPGIGGIIVSPTLC